MKNHLLYIAGYLALLFTSLANYAQAPSLGIAGDFVLFTTTGDITNTGTSQITGNIGTNAGSIIGYTAVNGSVHNGNSVTSQASADLLNAYNQLNAVTPTAYPGSVLGNGQTFNSGVYSMAAATSLNLTLTLDGQGNSDAVFIFLTGGALTTSASAQVILINGANACNVFWKIEGAASFATGTHMIGTIIANNGAISFGDGAQIEGRALSTAGAVTTYNTTASISNSCISTIISWTGAINTDWNLAGNWNGNVVPNGTTDVHIASGTPNMNVNYTQFLGKTLTLSGSAALVIAAGKTLTVKGTVDFAGNPVTIKSDATGTGAIGEITGNLSGATNVTVERYIPQNTNRAWRLLAVPTSGQSIKAAWQENQLAGVDGVAGFGTQITSSQANAVSLGFDAVTTSSSMYRYDSYSNVLRAVINTKDSIISAYQGYFLYIRGNRSQGASSSTTSNTATILRTKGSLNTGTKTTHILANKSALVANPYASAIDLRSITFSGSVDATTFRVWDPILNTLGSFQVFTKIGSDYTITPGGGSYSSSVVNTIESGQAFFISGGSNGGDIIIGENSKTAGGNQVFRPAGSKGAFAGLFTNLNVVKNIDYEIVDGTFIAMDNSYANEVDDYDGRKQNNFTENISMVRNGVKLSVEKRTSLSANDTVFYNLSSLRKLTYQLTFRAQNLEAGLTSILEDSYLKTSTPINLEGNSSYNFTVDANTGSSASSRFMLVIKQATVLPVNILSISAHRSAFGVKLNWKVAAEQGIRTYEVQRSADGRNFVTAGTVAAVANNTTSFNYNLLDGSAPITNLFYKVKSIGMAGEFKYSSIVKVGIGKQETAINVSPNPVENSIINLQLKNQSKGRYSVRLLAITGQALYSKVINHSGFNSSQALNLPSTITSGIYQLEVTLPDNSQQVQTLLIKSNK